VRTYPNIGEKFYFVQNYETDFYKPGETFRLQAEQSYNVDFGIKYVTISKWCQEWLLSKYKKQATYVPNGIDNSIFYPCKREFNRDRIRILIEGNSKDYYKNVDESFKIVDMLDKDKYEIWYMSYQGKPKEGYYVDQFLHNVPYEKVGDVYRACDILIKTSILESFSYPPLEMMATGGYVVVVPNGGNVEYLVDESNCLMYPQGDIQKAVQCIERIVTDARLREKLYQNGISVAKDRDWGKIEERILALYGC
jgi:glycosyltransferase involved in cell wall biosynthesis